ncbi:MAG: carboxymuconolactone decarboxylase family protein [Acidobacteria bacterium]|nr:carboxymuconolactone decarboxylase family protein [Acidobacteriota bacterium]
MEVQTTMRAPVTMSRVAPALAAVALAAATLPVPAVAMAQAALRAEPPRALETPAAGQGTPAEPRVLPADPRDEAEWTAEVRAGIESFGVDPDEATPLLRALARHPPALHGLGPLAAYLRSRSMVAAVDQILMGLRAAWLCRSEAVWAELAAEARTFGLLDDDLRRVAAGPDAGWGPWDAAVLRATDEIYRDSFLSDASWQAFAERYDAQQLLDVVFTGAEYVLLSMLANSLGVEPDERHRDRLPAGVERRIGPARPSPVRLAEPRLLPLPREDWSGEVRALLDPNGTGQPVLNLYATLARHPALYRPRAVQSAYIRTGATLTARAREILILRIGWLCGSEYEWAQHVRVARRVGMSDEEIRRVARGPDAPGWGPFEATLLRAADELHRTDAISDPTWQALAERYGPAELIDVVITVAGYRMVSIALNSLGTELEPGRERFPPR